MTTHTEQDMKLYEAAHENDLAGVRSALAGGANVNALIEGYNMLAFVEDVEIARELLAAGVDPNLSSPDHMPDAIFWAARAGRTEVVRLLLEAGARIELELGFYRRGGDQDSAFESSLHAAVEGGHNDVVRLLLESNGRCMLDKFNYVHRTPLMIAVEKENIDLAKMLIEAGSDVNAHDEPGTGETAIRHAVESGNADMVKLLLAAGADPRIRGWMAESAIDKAMTAGNPAIWELFESDGRNPNCD